jgi:isochorismate synthase
LDSNRTQSDLSGPSLDGRLDALLREASGKSRREGCPVLVSLTEPVHSGDPLTLFGAATDACRDRLLWSQPDSGLSLSAIGAAQVIETAGPHRFSQTAEAWNALCSGALIETGGAPYGPLLMGGFSFDTGYGTSALWRGYPDGRMVLPRVCLIVSRGCAWLTVNAVVSPGASSEEEAAEIVHLRRLLQAESAAIPNHPACPKPALSELGSASGWRREVATAAAAVRRGELGKVVLARAVKLEAAQHFDPARALRRLSAGYPTCVVFAVANGDRCFLGATPERLLRVSKGEVSTTCLAGSYPRGADAEADRKLAEALLADPKERREHALVLEPLVETLEAACTQLNVPPAPSVLKLPNVQHLCTPVSGRIAPGRSVLEIVEQLHPTPSVGGQPRDLALRFIREREGLDRGWYAGAVGWIDHRGEGEFAVAIRAALLCGAQATLFAGCGIVADSDPDREYAESCIKLTPMLSALGAN